MESKKEKLDWHKVFSQILTHGWTPLGLKVISEYQVAKDPLRIDVVVIQAEKLLSEKHLRQLPDGIREHLKSHNLIDFKSLHETYGYPELKKTDIYAGLYEMQEHVSPENLAVFAVSAMSPKKLLKEVHDFVQIWENGIYQVKLSFREIILLVPNEMEDKASNEIFELFASRKTQSLQALIKMVNNPFWSGLDGLEVLVQRLGKEWKMPGLDLNDLARQYKENIFKRVTPLEYAEIFKQMKDKEDALGHVIQQLDHPEDTLGKVLEKLSPEQKARLLKKLNMS